MSDRPPASPVEPGWQVDPEDPRSQRWWDGTSWTEVRRPLDRAHTDRGAIPATPTVSVPRLAPSPTNDTVIGQGPPLATSGADPRQASRPVLPWIIASGCFLAVIGLVVAFVISRSTSDPEPGGERAASSLTAPDSPPPSTAPSAVPQTSTTSQATLPAPVPPPLPSVASTSGPPPSPPPPPASTAMLARVTRTCGASGNGDCFVAVRVGPTSDTAEITRLTEGSQVEVTCQTRGEPVRSSILGAPTTVWVRDTAGRYMSGAFLDVNGWSPFTITTPCL